MEFRDVSFAYPGSERQVLDHISFALEPSQFMLICGKSGCGKSTLLRQMKKSLIPYGNLEGEVLYRGTLIEKMEARDAACEIGFVSQNPENQIVTNKVWHELAFGLESMGFDNNTIRKRVAEMASYFGIQTWFRKNVYELSGGQKQILNLASVMVMQPNVLILDEPTSQLDPIAAAEFIDTLRKINRELGTTIIMSEHRLEEVFPVADKVLVMEEGKVSICDSVRKVGKFLTQEKKRHQMYYGLPSIMKIFAEVKPEGECPVTVREGRLWLKDILPDIIVSPRIDRTVSDTSGEVLIDIEDVWFRYERKANDVIRALSFQIYKGEFLCIIGGNGVGKSTSIKLLSGIYKPYRGKIKVAGRALKDQKQYKIGVLPQNPQAVFTETTVLEELFAVKYYDKGSDKEKQKEIDESLELMELSHLKKAHAFDLSGGEQQRLALAKLLMTKPDVLVLDEPTKGLDPFFKRKLADILQKLKEDGITIVMVTHDIEFCAEYADRCAMFFDGNIVASGRPEEFFCGNRFYTTTSHRVSRDFFENAVIYQDVVKLCVENMK